MRTKKEEVSEKETPVVDNQNQTEEETPKEEVVEKKEEVSEKDGAVDKILQLYPQYESLYVDSKGFVFTEGTSKAMRGNAKLYKNKYFKK